MSEEALRITPDMVLRRRVDFERRMRRLPPVTLGVIVVLVAIFALELGLEILDSPEALLLVGALSRDAVMQGEWWRLVTAVFLHGGVEHVVGNAIALLVLGMVCEHAFGRVQFAWLFVMSGIAGSVLSMLATPGPSVGASGAIFGLQGAAVVLFRRHRERLLMRDRRIGVVLIVWALYTIATGLVTPYVDNGAHIGGFLGGALLARGLHPMVLEPPS
ncbi:MAG TPA: rhomboid family intramembrane serine protease, partial [Terriglobales bacterium]|nr:rhomboid family intramembrane serine protease [Terriglobales bacterium]